MTTHTGKIARLSRRRRDDIGRRLQNGQPGGEILRWLNKLKDVRAVLRTQFGGRRINKQNLSAWRRSGHVEWLELERQQRSVRQRVEEAEALAKTVGKRSLGNGLAITLALEMHGLTKTLLKEETNPEKRWERVRELHREVSRLRRDDDRVKRTGLREAQVQGLKSKVQSRKRQEEDWDPPSQGYGAARPPMPVCDLTCPPAQGDEAAREAVEAWGGKQAGEDEHEDPPSQGYGAASQDESRQVKAGQGKTDVQNPKSEVKLSRVAERGPVSPGEEYVKIRDKTGLWFEVVPKGWVLPADWKSPDELARMRRERLEVQSPMSKVQTRGNEAGEGRGIIGRGMEEPQQNPKSKAQSLNGQAGALLGSGGGTLLELAGEDACGTNTIALPSAAPYVPDPDPEVEAYNRWWRMNRNFERFNYEELQRIYAELPRKIAEYKAKMQGGEGAECVEGAGI